MKEKYFVVRMDEDGDWFFCAYDTIEEVKKYYGIDEPTGDYAEGYHPAQDFTDDIDDTRSGTILIKGVILLPKAKEIKTVWDFEEGGHMWSE